MYAMLGEVRFELLNSFTSLETQHAANFAKHEVLKGRPRLQALQNELTTLRFSLKLHWRLGNPDTAYKGLLSALEAQQAVSLVYGSGRFVGWFVLERLTERTLIQDAQGRTAARELDVELIPQGTLAERCRAGGAGIPAFFTPAGYGTEVAEGKETREFEGKMYVMEKWLRPDFAIVKAWKGDSLGNLVYKHTARNFNPVMAMAGKITVAEVEELVEPGELDPNTIHTPGIFVQRIFQGTNYEKRIEQRTVRKA